MWPAFSSTGLKKTWLMCRNIIGAGYQLEWGEVDLKERPTEFELISDWDHSIPWCSRGLVPPALSTQLVLRSLSARLELARARITWHANGHYTGHLLARGHLIEQIACL